MNGTRIGQGVDVKSATAAADVLQIEIPVWLDFFQRLAGHPGGKSFVQPDVVPPFHGDEIAEPLVRHLVRDHAGDAFLQVHRTLLVVNKKNHFAEGNAAGVLHCAGGEIRQADQIKLPVWILDTEIIVVILQDVACHLQSEGAHFFFAGGCIHADRNAVGFAFDVLKIAHHQRGQVGRHLRRGGKFHRVLFARARLVGNNSLVGDRRHALVRNRSDVECGFVIRFVERGIRAASVRDAARISRARSPRTACRAPRRS